MVQYSTIYEAFTVLEEVLKMKNRLVTRSDFDGLVCAMLLKELDIPVDATNVSSADQFEKLRKYGCTYFQGTYLNEPLPSDKVVEYIKNYKKRSST